MAMKVLLIVLAVSALSALFESVYFAAWYTSRAGLLPEVVSDTLVRPELVFIPKLINLLAAIFILFILIRRWIPQLNQDQKDHRERMEMLSRAVEKSQQVEADQCEHSRHYLSLLENRNAVSWELDLSDSTFTYVSPNAERLLGYSVQEWEDINSWVSMIIPEDRDYATEHCQIETAAGRDHTFEYRIQKKSGEIIWVLDVVRVLKNSQGEPDKLAGIILDNSDQHKLREQLEQSQKIYKEAQETAHLGNWELDIVTGKVTCSETIYQFLDLDLNQSIDLESLSTIVHPQDWPTLETALKASIENGTSRDMEFRIICPDGKVRWGYLKVERQLNALGNAQKLVGIVQDVSERKAAERELRLLEYALDHVEEAAYLIDEKAHFQYVNQGAIRHLGYTRDELLNMGVADIDPVFPTQAWPQHWHELQQKRSMTFESVHQRKDGTTYANEINANYLSFEEHSYNLAFVRDITQRNQLQEELQMERLQLKEAQRIAQLGSWEWRVESDELKWSEQLFRILGLEPDVVQPSYDYYLQQIHPDDRDYFKSWTQKVLAEESSYEIEYRIVTAFDEEKIIRERGEAKSDDAGQVISLTGTVQNITEMKRAENQLRSNEQKYRSLVETTSEGFWMIDLTLMTLDVNQSLCNMLNYHKEEMLGRSVFDFVDADNRKVFEHQTSQIATTPHRRYEISLNRCGGGLVPTIFEATTLKDLSGNPIGAFAFVTDISQRKAMEDDLQLAASVFSHASEGIIITDPNARILDVNDSFVRITGYQRDETLGKNPHILQSGRHDSSFYRQMWQDLTQKGHWFGEIWNRHKNGEVFAEMLRINAVKNKNGKTLHYVALFTDITNQKEQQKQLEHIAHFDALTNLPNRVLLADRLAQAMAQVRRRDNQLAVAYLDLDGFKEINDEYGHDVGDDLLINIAARLHEVLREEDTVARLGGDEFVAVLVNLSTQKDCVPLLERLLSAAATPIHVGDKVLQISGSLGVTFYPQAELIDSDQLLRQADYAMYEAKQAGKNRYKLFDSEQDRSIRGHHETLERIRQALEDNEFLLHYQPKVNMRSGEVIGVEALIRWQHPDKGLLPPAVFLPVVEEDYLSVALGNWVIQTALSQLEQWHQNGLRLSVSVNIGAMHLQQPDFTERLSGYLASSQVDNHFVELEVLETSALQDIAHVSQIINDCHDLGVKFALDDFGTGYSSLTYLKRLPATILKIDQSFVRDMLEDPDDLAILEGVLGLSAAFRREVVAEGAETEAHCELLLRLGCDVAQGYGIARPLSADAIPNWVANWQVNPKWKSIKRVLRDDQSMLIASIEHRAWVKNIEDYIQGNNQSHPEVASNKCRFGHWLFGEGNQRYGHLDSFQKVNILHEQIHEIGTSLCAHGQKEQSGQTQEQLSKVREIRDKLLIQMEQLLDKSQKERFH